MKLDLLLIADMANVDASGKFNIVGEFNMIRATSIPTQPINMVLVTRLVAAASEATEHEISVHLVDEDGQPVAKLEGAHATFARAIPGTSGDQRAQFVLGLNNIRFPKLGTFAFHVLVDGRFIDSRAFHVVAASPDALTSGDDAPEALPPAPTD